MKNEVINRAIQCFVCHYFSFEWVREFILKKKVEKFLNSANLMANNLLTSLHPDALHLLFLIRVAHEDNELALEVIPKIFGLILDLDADLPVNSIPNSFSSEYSGFGRRDNMRNLEWLYLYADIKDRISRSQSTPIKTEFNQLLKALLSEKGVSFLYPQRKVYPVYLSLKKLETENSMYPYSKLLESSQRCLLSQWIDLEWSQRYEFERTKSEEDFQKYFHWLYLQTNSNSEILPKQEGVKLSNETLARLWLKLKKERMLSFPPKVTINSLNFDEMAKLYKFLLEIEDLWESAHKWNRSTQFNRFLELLQIHNQFSQIAIETSQEVIQVYDLTNSNNNNNNNTMQLSKIIKRFQMFLGYLSNELNKRQQEYETSLKLFQSLNTLYTHCPVLIDFFQLKKQDYLNYLSEYFSTFLDEFSETMKIGKFEEITNQFNLLNYYSNYFHLIEKDLVLFSYYCHWIESSRGDNLDLHEIYEKGIDLWLLLHSDIVIVMVKRNCRNQWTDSILFNIDKKLLQLSNLHLSPFKLQTISYFFDVLLSFDYPHFDSARHFNNSIILINDIIDMIAIDSITDETSQEIYCKAISMIEELFWLVNDVSFRVHRFRIFSVLYDRSEYAAILGRVLSLYEHENQLESYIVLMSLLVREGLPEMIEDCQLIETTIANNPKVMQHPLSHDMQDIAKSALVFLLDEPKELAEVGIGPYFLESSKRDQLFFLFHAWVAYSRNFGQMLSTWKGILLQHRNDQEYMESNRVYIEFILQMENFDLLNKNQDYSLEEIELLHECLFQDNSNRFQQKAFLEGTSSFTRALRLYEEYKKKKKNADEEGTEEEEEEAEEINRYIRLSILYFKQVQLAESISKKRRKSRRNQDSNDVHDDDDDEQVIMRNEIEEQIHRITSSLREMKEIV